VVVLAPFAASFQKWLSETIFLALSGTNSLFQQTVERANKISNTNISSSKPIIVTNEEHRFLAVEQLRELKIEADFLLEPMGRNTAPALTLASMMVKDRCCQKTSLWL
jgi:mannose-1-phosphate guanylyltransferase/mannose-6-phosphate isomerase